MYIIVVTFHEFAPNSARIIDNRFPRFSNGGDSVYQVHEAYVDRFMQDAKNNTHVKSCQKYRYEP